MSAYPLMRPIRSTAPYSLFPKNMPTVFRAPIASSDVPTVVAPKVPMMMSTSAGGAISDAGLPPSMIIEPKMAPKAHTRPISVPLPMVRLHPFCTPQGPSQDADRCGAFPAAEIDRVPDRCEANGGPEAHKFRTTGVHRGSRPNGPGQWPRLHRLDDRAWARMSQEKTEKPDSTPASRGPQAWPVAALDGSRPGGRTPRDPSSCSPARCATCATPS